MDRPAKLQSIEEVSLQLEIPKHTLRFWEKAFAGILVPQRTPGGQRRYAPENISTLGEIKELRKRGMRLSDIKRELTNGTKASHLKFGRIDLLANRAAEVVRAEVYEFFKEE